VKHVFVKAAARVTTVQRTAISPRGSASDACEAFRDPKRTQAFLSSFAPIRQHFALKRHLLRASLYRKHLAARFVA
jgi:putative transposase